MLPDFVCELAEKDPVGLLPRGQLLALGVTDAMIMEWRLAGLLVGHAPGWYGVGGANIPSELCLHLPIRYLDRFGSNPPARLTGYGGLAGLDVPGFDLPCHPTVLIQRGNQVRVTDPPWSTRQTDLVDQPVVRRGRVRMASGARCVADLVVEGTETAQVIAAVDGVRNRLRLDLLDLVEEWEALARRGHRGARVLLGLAGSGVLDPESGGERRALTELFEAIPPAPDCQVWVTERYRVDFAFVFAALIIEYYGEEAHADRVDRDAVRIRVLRSLGWDVYIVTKSLVHDGLAVAQEIHQLRREREQLILSGRLRRPPLPAQDRRTALRTLVPLG